MKWIVKLINKISGKMHDRTVYAANVNDALGKALSEAKADTGDDHNIVAAKQEG